MLAKKFHLPIQENYDKRGKKISTHFFTVKKTLSTLPYSRFGVVVSKKISKSSVRRNWFRRIFFDLVRTNNLYKIPNHDVMVILLPQAALLAKADFIKKLEEALL